MQSPQEDHPFFEHLPEFYWQDPALIALLAVFERFYLRQEAVIDELPQALYEIARTPPQLLDCLGGLVGLRNENQFFSPEQMRVLIPVAFGIQRKKGTRWALSAILQAYLQAVCGRPLRPLIIEYSDWQEAAMPREILEQCSALYRGIDDVVLLLPPEPALLQPQEQERLEHLASLYCPATATAHVVVLPSSPVLDSLTYLDLNTYL